MDSDNKHNKNNVRKKESVTHKQSLGFSSDVITVVNGGYSGGMKAFTAMRLHGGIPRNKTFF